MFIVTDLVSLISELAGARMMPIGISSTCQYLSVLSAGSLCKHFVSRSGLTKWFDLDPNFLTA